MDIATIGIDLSKTTFHVIGLDPKRRDCVAQKTLPQAVAALHCEPAADVDRHGSLRGSTLSWPRTAKTRA